jgi:hypothetical protein
VAFKTFRWLVVLALAGKVDLDDPASTIVLLKANAVVGITGHFGSTGQLSSIGVQCASSSSI